MRENIFKIGVVMAAAIFLLVFCILVIPAFIKNPDIVGAFGGGFVNPFASGYSTDVICCWMILFVWIIYEYPKVQYGWVCLLLGIIPGVAVGFAMYLLLRTKQLKENLNP